MVFGYQTRPAARTGRCAALALSALLACCLWTGKPAGAQDNADAPMHFAIPPQTLATALRQYAERTGKSVFFDTALTGGKLSAPLQGEYTAEAALEILLRGSGLAVKNTSASAFTLVAQDHAQQTAADLAAGPENGAGAEMQEPPQDWRRARRIQAALEQALCRDGETYPGTYRALIRVWLDAGGRVQRGGLLGSTGVAARDQAIARALQTLAIGPQDAAMLAQPVIILLLPRTEGAADVCLAAGREH